MVHNLMKKGFNVVVYDISPQNVKQVQVVFLTPVVLRRFWCVSFALAYSQGIRLHFCVWRLQTLQEWAKGAGRTATAAASPLELAQQVDVVVTMLPSSPHVKEVRFYARTHARMLRQLTPPCCCWCLFVCLSVAF